MTPTYAMIVIAVVAICTFFTRLFPFLLFGRKGEPSPTIRFLGQALPPAVIAILVIYCIKGIDFTLAASVIPQAISIAVVILLHIWRRNNLLSIGLGTVCYMILVQCIF